MDAAPNPITFHPNATIDEKLYELVEHVAGTHYHPTEAAWYLDRFIATARVLIEEYNDVGDELTGGGSCCGA